MIIAIELGWLLAIILFAMLIGILIGAALVRPREYRFER